MNVRIVVTGRSYHTAESLPTELSLPPGATLDDALAALRSAVPADQALPASCLVAVSGKHVGTIADHLPSPLAEGDEVLLLAPVAGG